MLNKEKVSKTIEFKGNYLPSSFATQHFPKYKAVKSHCGIGGTTAILKGFEQSIILTPNVSQIKDKEANKDEFNTDKVRVLYIYEGSKDRFADFYELSNRGYIVHIFATYSQLNINKKNILQFKDSHRLVCDEYHCLTAYTFMDLYENTKIIIDSFKGVILTTATENAIPCFNDFPIIYYKGVDLPPNEIEFREFRKQNEIKSFAQSIDSDVHIVIVSNDIKVHRDWFKDSDHYVGSTLEKKIAPYNINENYKKFDYNKKIHIISSTAWEGVDFERDGIILVVGEYSHVSVKRQYGVTQSQTFQAIGRCRKHKQRICFLYTMSKDYLKNLDNYPASDNWSDESKEGIKQLFSFTKNDSYYRKDYDRKVLVNKSIFKTSAIEVMSNLSKYENTSLISHDIISHLNIERVVKVSRDNETSRDGVQSGLNTKEALLYLSHGIINECNGFRGLSNSSINHVRNDKSQRALFSHIHKAISKAYHSHGFLSNSLESECFNDSNVRLSPLSKCIYEYIISNVIDCNCDSYNAYADKITSCNKLIVKMAEQGKQSLNHQQLTEHQQRQKRKALIYINFIAIQNTTTGTKTIKKATQTAREYLHSDIYKLKIKNNHNPLTVKGIMKHHKMFMIEKLIAFNGRHDLIELTRGNRKFSLLTSHPRPMRKIDSFVGNEIDMKSAYPQICGNLFSKNVLNRIEAGQIYHSDKFTRDEMKVKVNKALNLHDKISSQPERIQSLMEAGFKYNEAYTFVHRFAKKGSFYEFATAIEDKAMNELTNRLQPLKTPLYRLHDAIFIFGNHNLQNFTKPIQIDRFQYPLSTKQHQIKQLHSRVA